MPRRLPFPSLTCDIERLIIDIETRSRGHGDRRGQDEGRARSVREHVDLAPGGGGLDEQGLERTAGGVGTIYKAATGRRKRRRTRTVGDGDYRAVSKVWYRTRIRDAHVETT